MHWRLSLSLPRTRLHYILHELLRPEKHRTQAQPVGTNVGLVVHEAVCDTSCWLLRVTRCGAPTMWYVLPTHLYGQRVPPTNYPEM